MKDPWRELIRYGSADGTVSHDMVQRIQQLLQISNAQVDGAAGIQKSKLAPLNLGPSDMAANTPLARLGQGWGCYVARTVDQSIANSTWTAAVFNSGDDPHGMWDGFGTITIPFAGAWLVTATCDWTTNGVGLRAMAPFQSGFLGTAGYSYFDSRVAANAAFDQSLVGSRAGRMAAGVAWQLGVFQSSGGPLSIIATGGTMLLAATMSATYLGA